MHLSLSDLVTCPRCGPLHGLILLPHEVTARRVATGVLGCANCREQYRVSGGVADLRVEGGESLGGGEESAAVAVGAVPPPEEAMRLAALLALADVTGPVLLAGPAGSTAASLAALLEAVEVVRLHGSGPAPPAGEAEVDQPGAGVSAILAGGGLPFRTGAMSGVALTGGSVALLEDGLRVLRPGARLVLEPGAGMAGRVEAGGGRVVLAEENVLVVVRVP